MKHILLLFSVLAIASMNLCAQEQLADPLEGRLFAYPLAPDSCSTLESRCNYIIGQFWENYDISKPITDDIAFELTFRDFVDFFRYAHRNVVMNAVSSLVNKAQSNTSNLQKLGEVAERALYGPTAEYWSDEVYAAFAKPLASSKQLPRSLRDHYATQLARINSVQVGQPLDIEYIGVDGLKHRLSDLEAKYYILLFVNDSSDSMIGRLRLSTDVALNSLINSGNAVLLCLCLNKYSADWANAAAGYADNWVIGCSENLEKTLDLRSLPCCYLLNEQHVVANKSLTVDGVIQVVSPNY